MSLSAGSRIGAYEIVSPIGAGGMGEVYRARDTKLSRDVAIKILPDLFARDPERLARFQREAQVLASLNHPNIAQIYGLEESAGLRALVMELVAGEDLSQRIVRGPIHLAEALAIARQIADALEAAHEQGIIHRDLKPANIKVRDDGTVKVLDFGLAKALDPAGVGDGHADLATLTSPAMTAQGIILGTAAYMSPEQARGKVVDKRADIWAFGCVVYETLTGTRAFAGETLTDVLAAVVKSDPDWQALPPDTPRSVRALLRRCLQKDPVRRLHDIADARIEIHDAIAEPEVPAQAPERRRAARWMSLAPWTAAALLAVALVVTQVGPLRPVSPILSVAHLELNLPPGIEPYTSTQGVAFSPDGARVAFIGIVAGYKQVYVRDLDKFDAVPVRGTDNATSVFFSPNGRNIGVILANRVLEKVSLDDGLVVHLARGADIQRGGAWGPDDRITFARENVLWQVPASAGTPTQLTFLTAGKGELRHGFPTVVSGGKALLFAVVTGSSRDAVHIEALSLVTHNREEVGELGTGPLFVAGGRLIFSRDGAVLAAPFDEERLQVTGPAVKVIDRLRLSSMGQPVVAVSGSGAVAYMSGTSVSQLVWVSRQGVEQPITDTDRMYDFPRLEPLNGRRVLVSASGDLWIKDTVGKAFTVQNTQTTTGNSYPVWTLDAKRVVFRTSTGQYAMDVDSGRPQLIPDTSANDYPSSVSRNGDTLIFVRVTEEASGDVYALSLRDEPKPHALVNTPGYDGGPQLSPDGHWLVYASNASPTEPFQLFVSSFPGLEGRWPVSQSGMFPRWTKNGAELVYRDGNKMMAVDVSIKNGAPTFSSPQRLFDDRYLFGPSTSIANYDVSPDGQRFVMVKGEPGSSRLNIVLNWFDELRRLAPTK